MSLNRGFLLSVFTSIVFLFLGITSVFGAVHTDSTSVGIIGGSDGPTAIYIAAPTDEGNAD